MLYHTTDSPSYKQTIAEVWFRDEPSAERAGFTHWSKGRAKPGGAAKFAEVPPGPHGPGSAKPNADGSGPEGWTVKGNEDSMLYHSPESPRTGDDRRGLVPRRGDRREGGLRPLGQRQVAARTEVALPGPGQPQQQPRAAQRAGLQ